MSRLIGKRVIITGGATGIGAAIVRRFVAEGAAVVILDLNEADARALADEIAIGGTVQVMACDVADVDRGDHLTASLR